MAVVAKPRDLRRRAIEEVAIPLPIPEMTPPEIKMYLVLIKIKTPRGVPAYILSKLDLACQEVIRSLFKRFWYSFKTHS